MQKGVARRVPAPEIKGSCATQAGVTGRWVHPPHGNYFTGNRIPNGFGWMSRTHFDGHVSVVFQFFQLFSFSVFVVRQWRRGKPAHPPVGT